MLLPAIGTGAPLIWLLCGGFIATATLCFAALCALTFFDQMPQFFWDVQTIGHLVPSDMDIDGISGTNQVRPFG